MKHIRYCWCVQEQPPGKWSDIVGSWQKSIQVYSSMSVCDCLMCLCTSCGNVAHTKSMDSWIISGILQECLFFLIMWKHLEKLPWLLTVPCLWSRLGYVRIIWTETSQQKPMQLHLISGFIWILSWMAILPSQNPPRSCKFWRLFAKGASRYSQSLSIGSCCIQDHFGTLKLCDVVHILLCHCPQVETKSHLGMAGWDMNLTRKEM